LAEQQDCDCYAVDMLAAAHLNKIERKIEDLELVRRELRSVIKRCTGGSVARCRIIERLTPKAGSRRR